MKICGIEIKGSEAIIVVTELTKGEITHVSAETKRIKLHDDEDSGQIKSFSELVRGFTRDNKVDLTAIKKRNKLGQFSGGAVTFKIEGIVQLMSDCEVVLLAATTVSAATKKHGFTLPASLKIYQHDAFLTACTAHARNGE